MNVAFTPRLIEKENITGLRFPEEDVLSSSAERENRIKDLKNARELGDLAQYKVKILFVDDSGPKKVETTVWNTTQEEVVLKYGIAIPIRRVSKVMFP
ncbi:MAG TPA: hypothetical protein DCX54_07165 [Flavobacteriales bacterium]|nr:hypothetical protein [Flavobacteriales bacterium]